MHLYPLVSCTITLPAYFPGLTRLNRICFQEPSLATSQRAPPSSSHATRRSGSSSTIIHHFVAAASCSAEIMTAAPCGCHRAFLTMAPLQRERMLQTVVTCVSVSQGSLTDLTTCTVASIPAIRGITHATLVLPIAPMAGREVRAAVEGVPRAVI